MRLYECIVDDGQNVFKTLVNGSFEKITDVTKDYFTNESSDKLVSDLQKCGWGKGEVELIRALLEEHIDKLNK